MKRISSRITFVYKRVFPILWFCALLAFATNAAFFPKIGHSVSPWYYSALLLMGLGAYYVMKTMAFDLADDVFDSGDFLVVRFAKETQHISLNEIVNVKYSPAMSPRALFYFCATLEYLVKKLPFQRHIIRCHL